MYRDNLDSVTALASDLSVEQLSLRVPGSPDWTAHDVLAHLAGGPADLLGDRMDGAPTPAWSARHVDERAARSPEELVDEMRTNVGPVLEALGGSQRPAVVWDIAVHHADLHEAFDLGRPPEPMWRPVLDAAAPALLRDHAPAFAGVEPYELFRGLFSRRSSGQMAAWETGLDQQALDDVPVFGPRDDDQPVPA